MTVAKQYALPFLEGNVNISWFSLDDLNDTFMYVQCIWIFFNEFQIIEEFRGDISLWVSSATRGYTSTGTQDPTDIEGICRVELLETLKHPYMDGCKYIVMHY